MTLIDELARALRGLVDASGQYNNVKSSPHQLETERNKARELLARYAATKAADNDRTHWDGCWRDRTHHACAVAKIEELQAKAEGAQAPALGKDCNKK